MKKLLKILIAVEFVLILVIIALFLIENKNDNTPTAFAVKEPSIEEIDFKILTKAVCEEESEHITCRDKLFVKCDGKEYIINENNLENFTDCNVKLNLSGAKVNGSITFRK